MTDVDAFARALLAIDRLPPPVIGLAREYLALSAEVASWRRHFAAVDLDKQPLRAALHEVLDLVPWHAIDGTRLDELRALAGPREDT